MQDQDIATLTLLDQLTKDETQETRILEAMPLDEKFAEHVVKALIDCPEIFGEHVDAITDDIFTDPQHKRIVLHWQLYRQSFLVMPTRNSLSVHAMLEGLTEDDNYQLIVEMLSPKRPSIDPSLIPLVKSKFKEYLKRRLQDQLHNDVVFEDPVADMDRRKAIMNQIAVLDGGSTTKFGFKNLATLIADYKPPVWLCDGIMTAGQPFILAGPKKCLKTGILCDLALSFATCGSFLGKFPVTEPCNVAFFSAESGDSELIGRLKAVMASKGIETLPENLHISFAAPKLSDPDDIAAIAAFVKANAIKIVIIDPMYLTLLSGNTETNAGNVLQMGPILRGIAAAIIEQGATPVLCHHTRKNMKPGQDLDLDDMSYAGFAEFARQSLLVWRREPIAGIEDNKLCVKTHGFMRANCYHVDIAETNWAVSVTDREMVVKTDSRDKGEERQDKVFEAIRELEQQGKKVTKTAIGLKSGVTNAVRLHGVLTELLEEDFITAVKVGKGTEFRCIKK